LQWYATLEDTKSHQLQEAINSMQENTRPVVEVDDQEAHSADDIPAHNQTEEPVNNHPSEYLRERCPACFGGSNWHQPDEIADAIVCIDACFTQKCQKSQGKTSSVPHDHPSTIFVPPADVADTQSHVENVQPAPPKPKEPLADGFEPGMKVSAAILDECYESFQATDSNCVKASTKFFANTGLMGLLCHHDQVLWLVNMTSASEKQYYALCLLEHLFKNIPATM
ncbi:hypothetical protein CPB84DRAFT_1698862, partial [Gymnopilus junonius]